VNLNNQRESLCKQFAEAARWDFKWGLARKVQACKAGEKSPTAFDLRRGLNDLKKTDKHLDV